MATATICPSCELPFRAGSLVLVLDGRKATRRRVCKPCARSAVPVLFDPGPGRVRLKCEECKARTATICRTCVAGALSSNAAAITSVRKRAPKVST